MDRSEYLIKLYVERDYQGLTDALKQNQLSKEDIARFFLCMGIFDCAASLYRQEGMLFESAYCSLLSGNLEKAKKGFENLGEENPVCLWELNLISVLEGNYKISPTFLQIRNFLEIDFSLFIQYKKHDFVQNTLNAANIFAEFNPECYKYFGRVLLNYKLWVLALRFLSKWKDIEYNDPENHYLLAKCYTRMGFDKLARSAINNCLEIAPKYYPALTFFDKDKIL